MANYAYKRVSTTDQVTLRQLDNINVEFDKVFEDKLTGANTVRPQYQLMVSCLEDGDHVWVHDITRLSRSTKDLLEIVESWKKLGVTVHFIKENLVFDSKGENAVSNFMFTIMSALAQMDRETISINTIEGLRATKARGTLLGAANPKYKRNPNNATKRNRTEALERVKYLYEPVSLIVNMLGTKATYKNIASVLTENGFPLPSGSIGTWNPSQASRVLNKLNIQRG